MTDEQKTDTAEVTKEADAEPIQEEQEEAAEVKKESSSQIDYEAELKRERDAREKAQKALADRAFKERKVKREEPEETEEVEPEERPITAQELQRILAEERQANQKELRAARAEALADTLSSSPAERDLILDIYTSRTFPSHYSLEEQMEEAYVIANRKKILGERNELARALRGKAGVNDNPAASHKDAPQGNAPKIAPQEAQALKAAGFVWNGTSRRYEKKLPDNHLLIRDPKTGQAYRE